jgi:hypothetical protein
MEAKVPTFSVLLLGLIPGSTAKAIDMLLCWVRDDSDSVWLELYYRFLVLERHINPGDLVPVLVILLHVRI